MKLAVFWWPGKLRQLQKFVISPNNPKRWYISKVIHCLSILTPDLSRSWDVHSPMSCYLSNDVLVKQFTNFVYKVLAISLKLSKSLCRVWNNPLCQTTNGKPRGGHRTCVTDKTNRKVVYIIISVNGCEKRLIFLRDCPFNTCIFKKYAP